MFNSEFRGDRQLLSLFVPVSMRHKYNLATISYRRIMWDHTRDDDGFSGPPGHRAVELGTGTRGPSVDS
jgi:hypothetical protein